MSAKTPDAIIPDAIPAKPPATPHVEDMENLSLNPDSTIVATDEDTVSDDDESKPPSVSSDGGSSTEASKK